MDRSRGLATIYIRNRTSIIYFPSASPEVSETSTLGAHSSFTEIYFSLFRSFLFAIFKTSKGPIDRPVVDFPTLSRTLALDLRDCTLRARSPLDRSRTQSEPKRAVSFYIYREKTTALARCATRRFDVNLSHLCNRPPAGERARERGGKKKKEREREIAWLTVQR